MIAYCCGTGCSPHVDRVQSAHLRGRVCKCECVSAFDFASVDKVHLDVIKKLMDLFCINRSALSFEDGKADKVPVRCCRPSLSVSHPYLRSHARVVQVNLVERLTAWLENPQPSLVGKTPAASSKPKASKATATPVKATKSTKSAKAKPGTPSDDGSGSDSDSDTPSKGTAVKVRRGLRPDTPVRSVAQVCLFLFLSASIPPPPHIPSTQRKRKKMFGASANMLSKKPATAAAKAAATPSTTRKSPAKTASTKAKKAPPKQAGAKKAKAKAKATVDADGSNSDGDDDGVESEEPELTSSSDSDDGDYGSSSKKKRKNKKQKRSVSKPSKLSKKDSDGGSDGDGSGDGGDDSGGDGGDSGSDDASKGDEGTSALKMSAVKAAVHRIMDDKASDPTFTLKLVRPRVKGYCSLPAVVFVPAWCWLSL